LLRRNNAAFLLATLEPEEIAEMLSGLTQQRRAEVSANAFALAKREFMLVDQRRKFWDAFSSVLSPT
jgi:hypothetical protein